MQPPNKRCPDREDQATQESGRTTSQCTSRTVNVDVCAGCEYWITGELRFISPAGEVRCRYCWSDRRQSLNYTDRTETRETLLKQARASTGWAAKFARLVNLALLRGAL